MMSIINMHRWILLWGLEIRSQERSEAELRARGNAWHLNETGACIVIIHTTSQIKVAADAILVPRMRFRLQLSLDL